MNIAKHEGLGYVGDETWGRIWINNVVFSGNSIGKSRSWYWRTVNANLDECKDH